MFLIEDGRSQFYQWDLNRRLIIEDQEITQVHFCNRTDECSLVCDAYTEDGIRLVDVPNVLLQSNWRINVYAFDKEYTKHNAVFTVIARTKPADYVYTETEVHTWNELDAKITEVQEGISDAVEDYLEQNPVEVDLSNYYDKEETDNAITTAIGNIEIPNPDLTGYATEAYVNEAIGSIDMPDVSAFQTEEQVIALINEYASGETLPAAEGVEF